MSLSFPTLGPNPSFQSVATWLTESSAALVAEGNAALDELKDLADVDFGDVGTSPVYNGTQWAYFAGQIGAAPSRPVIPTVNLNAILQQIMLLTPPNAPVVSFSYTDPGFVGVLRPTVADKLLFDLINGGHGIDINDEQALFDRARDRENQLMVQNEQEVIRRATATGFPLPQGVLSKQLEAAQMARVGKLSDVNRDIALKRADLFVANRRQVIEQAIQFESQGIELYNAMQNRSLLAARTQVEMAIFLYDAGIKVFQSQLAALTAQIEANLAVSTSIVNLYTADVGAYSATVNALMQSARIDMENSKNMLERDLRVYTSQVQIVQDRLAQLIASVSNRRDVAKYLTEFFRTGLGSAMNGINGLAVQTGEAPPAT